MKVQKHYLPARPLLREWMRSNVPEPGMLVWLESFALPILIGHVTLDGDGRGASRLDDLGVRAYAQIDLDEIEVVDA